MVDAKEKSPDIGSNEKYIANGQCEYDPSYSILAVSHYYDCLFSFQFSVTIYSDDLITGI